MEVIVVVRRPLKGEFFEYMSLTTDTQHALRCTMLFKAFD